MNQATPVEIPDEAVEQALLGAMGHDACADDEALKGDEYFTEQMRWALRAAAPLIVAAELRKLAKKLDLQVKSSRTFGGTNYAEGKADGIEVSSTHLLRHATKLDGGK